MRYSLVVCNGHKYQKEIKNLSKFLGLKGNDTDLEKITTFTTSFTDIDSLKEFLQKTNLLISSDKNKNLAIGEFIPNKMYPKTLYFNINFQKDLPFFDIEYLIAFFNSHIENYHFLKEFYYRFLNDSNIFNNKQFYNYLTELRDNGRFSSNTKEEVTKEIASFIRRFTANYDRIKGYTGINFKRLKVLASFTLQFVKEENIKTEKKNTSIEDLKLELANLNLLLQDNPTLEEMESYKLRIKNIKQELNDLKMVQCISLANKRFPKKERIYPY